MGSAMRTWHAGIPVEMAKVLVTGGTGFIGRHLVERLVERGDDVTCLVRNVKRAAVLGDLDVRSAIGDVTDAESLDDAVAGAEVVYHLAGATLVFSAEQFHRVNETGARNVADACAAQSTPPVLVFVSSLAAAGPTTPEQPRVESDLPNPVSNYGKSKWAGEQRLMEMAAKLPITIVRPPIVIGPR